MVYMQITKVAKERSVQKRTDYVHCIASKYIAEQLVFVDESSFDRRTTYRRQGWALQGQRAIRKTFFLRGKRYVQGQFCPLPYLAHDLADSQFFLLSAPQEC